MYKSPQAEIMILEDDHYTRYLCDSTLIGKGYSAMSVGDGKGASDCLVRGNLPDIDGVQLVNQPQEMASPPVLTVVSRSTPAEQRVHGFELGVADIVNKN